MSQRALTRFPYLAAPLACAALFLGCVFSAAQPTAAQPAAADTAFAAIHKEVLAVLPATDKAQATTLAYLKDKSGGEVLLPDYPANALLDWSRSQITAAGTDAKKLYPSVYAQLLVAQKLFGEKAASSERRGLRLTHNALLVSVMFLKDNKLASFIADGFLLPQLDAAYPQGRGTLSRRRLLQDAASAYRLNKQVDKQIVVLRALVQLAANEKDVDGADWARAKLAETLAARDKANDLSEGVQLLRAITAANMTGTRDTMLTRFEKKLKEKQAAEKKQQEAKQRQDIEVAQS